MTYSNANYKCVPNDALYTMPSKVVLFHTVKKAATVKCIFFFTLNTFAYEMAYNSA